MGREQAAADLVALTLTLSDGRVLAHDVTRALRHVDDPLPDDEFVAKFVDNARRAKLPLDHDAAERLAARLLRGEEARSAAEILMP